MRKRFLFLLSALLLMTSEIEAQNVVQYDHNGDGFVDISDVMSVIQMMRYAGGVARVVTGIELSSNELDLDPTSTYQPSSIQLTATVTPSNATNPHLEWRSSNENVVTVVDGLVTALEAGSAVITCTATDGSGVNASCAVIVYVDNSGVINGRQYVDLGLASRTLWATTNVGATRPSDYGTYFNYSSSSDPATTNWGRNWCTPTTAQWDELISRCTFTTTYQNNIKGCNVVGPNGNSIFLPYSGYYQKQGGVNALMQSTLEANYWYGDSSHAIVVNEDPHVEKFTISATYTMPVRPVRSKE